MSTHHLGAMLALYRASRRWSVRDVATQTGISAATLSRIERGQSMDLGTALRLLDWLLRPIIVDELHEHRGGTPS
jgi:transcriptional regulator with XRE-family HTH domain